MGTSLKHFIEPRKITKEEADRLFVLAKREYFAGLALQGLLANRSKEEDGWEKLEDIAKNAVISADYLIKELEK